MQFSSHFVPLEFEQRNQRPRAQCLCEVKNKQKPTEKDRFKWAQFDRFFVKVQFFIYIKEQNVGKNPKIACAISFSFIVFSF